MHGLPKHSLAQSRHYSEWMRARMPTGSYSKDSRQRAVVKISRRGYTSVFANCEAIGRRRRTEVRCNSFGRSSRSIASISGRYCRQPIFCAKALRTSRSKSHARYKCVRVAIASLLLLPAAYSLQVFRGSTINPCGFVDYPNVVEFDLQPVLRGSLVELRPLLRSDFDALFAAASDPLLWEQHPEPERYKREVFERFFDTAM